MNIFKSSCCVL